MGVCVCVCISLSLYIYIYIYIIGIHVYALIIQYRRTCYVHGVCITHKMLPVSYVASMYVCELPAYMH